MLNITLAQLESDIAPMMKGTSVRAIEDFYGTAAKAMARMMSRIDPVESARILTLTQPFFDNLETYSCPDDYKRMIDIRPQVNLRQDMPGLSDFSMTDTKSFSERLDANSFAIQWNNFVRTLRAQRLPAGNVNTMDDFDVTVSGGIANSNSGNGSWSGEGDLNMLYAELLNFVQGVSSLGFQLSGSTGAGDLLNTTAALTDLSAFNNEDSSMVYFWIPIGYSARFTSFTLLRGDNSSNYISQTVTKKADGTAFSDGWNLLLFNWSTGTIVGAPTNTQNTYRKFSIAYTAGTSIPGCLIDSWTDSFGQLYEIEYYSEYGFRDGSTGAWKARPTQDTDLVNVMPASYEILKTEMMVDITQIIRTGAVRAQELADWRLMLNGMPESRWVKDPTYKGLYFDYEAKFPSRAIVEQTRYYTFDV
jgi:hypothetical protein